jgi:hypothetical protein
MPEASNVWLLLLSPVKVMYSFWPKMGWATFWAIFLQTHLVTLVGTHDIFVRANKSSVAFKNTARPDANE